MKSLLSIDAVLSLKPTIFDIYCCIYAVLCIKYCINLLDLYVEMFKNDRCSIALRFLAQFIIKASPRLLSYFQYVEQDFATLQMN